MTYQISDEILDHIAELAKLELTESDREAVKADMGRMLQYFQEMNRLDTTTTEPLTHLFPPRNVFREDKVCNGDDSDNILKNAPLVKDDMFVAPPSFVR